MLSRYAVCALMVVVIHGCKFDKREQMDPVADSLRPVSETVQNDTTSIKISSDLTSADISKKTSASTAEKGRAEDVKPVSPKPKKPKKMAKIEVKEALLDVGDMTEGDVVDHRFLFKNVGNAPLEILEADVTCGCTTPSVPFLAVAPDDSGYIGVQYNSVGKDGPQSAEIHIKTNGYPRRVTLTIKANVIARTDITSDTLSRN